MIRKSLKILGCLFILLCCYSKNDQRYIEDNIAWTKHDTFNKLTLKQQATTMVLTKSIIKETIRKIDLLKSQGLEVLDADLDVSGGGIEDEDNIFVIATIDFLDVEKKPIVIHDFWQPCPEPDSLQTKEMIDKVVKKIIEELTIAGQIYL